MPREKLVTLYKETTKKEPEDTVRDIQKLLKDVSVKDVMTTFGNDGKVESMSFTIEREGQRLPFRLPVNHKPIWELAKKGRTRYISNEEQARRVAWRQIYAWIQAQLALIYTEMVTVEQIFLPYLVMDNQQTLYDKFVDGNRLLTEGSKDGFATDTIED